LPLGTFLINVTGCFALGLLATALAATRREHLFSLSHNLPVVVEIVDTDENVRQFLPCLNAMVREGMITTSEVEIIVYRAKR
jgi:PII-like signaling protein